MDFWDTFFDSDYRQRADIEALKRSYQSRRRARRLERDQIKDQLERINQLEDQVGELALLCRSLLTVLRENGTVQPEQFQAVMSRMDAEDGFVDGRITPQDDSDNESSTYHSPGSGRMT